jgi:hypothetical protein
MFLLQVNSHLSDRCECVAAHTSMNEAPKPYHHAGWGRTEEDLFTQFENLSGVSRATGQLRFIKLFYAKNHLNPCHPYSTVYQKLKDEKITVFYKLNKCPLHCFSIVSIVARDILEIEELNMLKKSVWSVVAKMFFPPVRGKGNGQVNLCKCNGTKLLPTGGSRSFGCTRSIGYHGRCKWFQRPVKKVGRMLFSLSEPAKSTSNSDTIKDICNTAADLCSKWTSKVAPIAASNMLRTGVNSQDCRLGREQPKLFSACNFVSDYVAHRHYDAYNLPDGLTSLISLQHEGHPSAQMHCVADYSLEEGGPPGVAFQLGDNSILIEAACREKHASTKISLPNFRHPSRVGLVLFQHQYLDRPDHGSL